MPNYTLRAPATHTLNHGGKPYRDGDVIVISQAEADAITNSHRFYRFEEHVSAKPAAPEKPATT